jgi:hypothetical protein
MPVRNVQAEQRSTMAENGCVLRRRHSKVVVRAPDTSAGAIACVTRERRARVSTLIGLGAREAMPTLFDVADRDELTCPRLLAISSSTDRELDEQWRLVPWDDDDDGATCFDV